MDRIIGQSGPGPAKTPASRGASDAHRWGFLGGLLWTGGALAYLWYRLVPPPENDGHATDGDGSSSVRGGGSFAVSEGGLENTRTGQLSIAFVLFAAGVLMRRREHSGPLDPQLRDIMPRSGLHAALDSNRSTVRYRPSRSIRLWLEEGPLCCHRSGGTSLEQWPGRGPDQPSQSHQAPDVWPRWIPSTASTGPTVLCNGTVICQGRARDRGRGANTTTFQQDGDERRTRASGCRFGGTIWIRWTSSASPLGERSHFRPPICPGMSARCAFGIPVAHLFRVSTGFE